MEVEKNEMERFKKKLVSLQMHLGVMLRGTAEEVKSSDDSKGYSQHQADEGTDGFTKVISLELSNKEKILLKQVERALEKIDDETYGVCDITGELIPLNRLEAVPYATMTVQAQERIEKGIA
ncbi:MAG: DnaK suppressor protein [Chlamydiales bacterium]